MEAPLKFQAPSLTIPVALEIGYLVFHALNGVEIALATILSAIAIYKPQGQPIFNRLRLVIVVLVAQTTLLYTRLDARTHAIINGETISEAPYHLVYIGMEVVKLGLLLTLAHQQINAFALGKKGL